MVRFILIVLISFQARADFLGFRTGDAPKSKLPPLIEKLKNLEMEDGPAYEEVFNQLVKTIELTIEEEKQFCSGEVTDSDGKVLGKEQRKLCFRDLKTNYLDAIDTIYILKKKYLGLLHSRQIENLSKIQNKLKGDIDKSF
jgi:hypothetical protein